MHNKFKRSQTKKVQELNMCTYYDYYMRLKLLALSMFKWDNLPKSLNAEYLERTLFYNGMCIAFNEPKIGLLWLKGASGGYLNHYDEPTNYKIVTGHNSFIKKEVDADDCIIIRNNMLNRPTCETIELYARKLADIDRTIEVNLSLQKIPLLVACDEKQRNTMLNLMNNYLGNIPLIFGTKDIDMDTIKKIDLNVEYKADKLTLQKKEIWNEVLSFLGIHTSNTEKKERLIVPEVTSESDVTTKSGNVFLKSRQKACDEINKKFGTNITVEIDYTLIDELLKEDNEDDVSNSYINGGE